MLNKILPTNDHTTKLADLFKNQPLYFVGANARNLMYGFPLSDPTYQFVLAKGDAMIVALGLKANGFEPDVINELVVKLTNNDYTVSILVMPLDEFLLTRDLAGDGVALRVSDGRLIVLPEYLTVPPTTQIIEGGSVPEDYLAAMKAFDDKVTALVQTHELR